MCVHACGLLDDTIADAVCTISSGENQERNYINFAKFLFLKCCTVKNMFRWFLSDMNYHFMQELRKIALLLFS